MHVADAQREVRQVYRGGFMGQLVSGVLWLGSAAAATWATPRAGILLLVIGGFFIFGLTTLGLRLRRAVVLSCRRICVGHGAVLLAFAVLGLQAARRERAQDAGTARPS